MNTITGNVCVLHGMALCGDNIIIIIVQTGIPDMASRNLIVQYSMITHTTLEVGNFPIQTLVAK
jgi:hypothetical protein